MPASTPGVDPTRVDTAQQYPLGYETGDPRAQDFPLNKIRYVRAGSAIALGDALRVDVTAAATEPNTLIPTSAVAQVVVGIAHVAIGSGSFGWVTTGGRVPSASISASVSADARLGSSATAGRLVTLAGVDSNFTSNIQNAIHAQAASVGILALDAGDSNAPIEVLLT